MSIPTKIGLFLLTATVAKGYHLCNNNDLTAFCLVTRQFRAITQSKTPPAYPQFQKMFNLELFPKKPYSNMEPLNQTIFTYQDLCDNDHIGYGPGSDNDIKRVRPENRQKNPYIVKTSLISLNGTILRNWLHFTVKADKTIVNVSKEATGKMKMGFLMVADENGSPVGDFAHDIPCGADCNCKHFKPTNVSGKPPRCLQAKRKEHVPCMFTDDKVISHPGMMIFYDEDGFDEVHATWHFAQSQDPNLFKYELHIKGLFVEDEKTKVEGLGKYIAPGTSKIRAGSNPDKRTGMFGWSPRYQLLFPTEKTVGGWDFFRKGVFRQKDINCHVPLTNASGLYNLVDYNYYTKPFNKYTKEEIELASKSERRLNGMDDDEARTFLAWQDQAHMYVGAPDFSYSWRDFGVSAYAFSGDEGKVQFSKNPRQKEAITPRLYFGTYKDEGANPRLYETDHPLDDKSKSLQKPLKERIDLKKAVRNKLKRFLKVRPGHVASDNCGCPLLPTEKPPQFKPKTRTQLMGRMSHVVQMSIAWICLVPFGIFVSRFFKETFSTVFFLQEFWWYSIHVLCMFTALVFSVGGIFVLEQMRDDPFNWRDIPVVAHSVVGIVTLGIFVIHCCVGFFRLKTIRSRLVQIMLHWLFGNFEYLLAMTSIVLSMLIVQGGFSCASFITLLIWQVVQFCFFFGMELHHRHVDKLMKLKPKRSYLPPPVMRLFHENSPHSSFRVKVLAVYFILCVLVVLLLAIMGELNTDNNSCFKSTPIEEA